jgi:hypothetical protein
MFNPLAALAAAKVATLLKRKDSVVELGNQTFAARGAVAGTEHVKTTREFYLAIGFKDYLAIDLNTKLDAVAFDLNKSLRRDYNFTRTFDLVTNNGTGEHIFDQRAVFENMHDLCAVGGIMLHILPTQRWVNHGFFNFQPVLFQDIAYANEYKWHMNFIGDRWARVAESAMDANGIKVDANTLEQIVMSPGWHGGGPLVVAAYEKTSDRPFSVPIQGGYHAAIEDRAQFSDYKLRE